MKELFELAQHIPAMRGSLMEEDHASAVAAAVEHTRWMREQWLALRAERDALKSDAWVLTQAFREATGRYPRPDERSLHAAVEVSLERDLEEFKALAEERTGMPYDAIPEGSAEDRENGATVCSRGSTHIVTSGSGFARVEIGP